MHVINIVKLIRATVSVFFVPCCPVLLSFYVVLSYMFELNKWNGMECILKVGFYANRQHQSVRRFALL